MKKKSASARSVTAGLSLIIAGSVVTLWLAWEGYFGDELPLLFAGVAGVAGLVGGLVVLAMSVVIREDVE